MLARTDYLSVMPFRIHFNNNKMWLHHIEHMKTPRFNFIFHLYAGNAVLLLLLLLLHSLPHSLSPFTILKTQINVNKLYIHLNVWTFTCIRTGHVLAFYRMKSWKMECSSNGTNICPILFTNTAKRTCYMATNLNIWPNLVVFLLQCVPLQLKLISNSFTFTFIFFWIIEKMQILNYYK